MIYTNEPNHARSAQHQWHQPVLEDLDQLQILMQLEIHQN